MVVFDIKVQNIGDLRGLDLPGNNLSLLGSLVVLLLRFPEPRIFIFGETW
jgi:hypothetical protein